MTSSNSTRFSPEEVAGRLWPSQPQLSPDGQHVAFTVAPASRKGKHPKSAIWLSRDGGTAERFTGGTAADSDPRWSPDGQHLAFLSDREIRGKRRLYVIPLTGGEARPIGTLKGDLSDPRWSPDGRTIAVLRLDPKTKAERKRGETRKDAIVVGADPKIQRLWLVDVTAGTRRQITFGPRQIWAYGWSRDGNALAICTTDGPDENASCGPGDLWTIPASGGLPKHVAHFPAVPMHPVFVETPAGEAIAVRMNAHREDPADSVWLAPLQGGVPVNALPNHSGNVEWLGEDVHNPGDVLVRIVEGVHGLAYRLSIVTGELTALSAGATHGSGSVVDGPSISAYGRRMAIVWSAGNQPQEVYLGATGAEVRPVTSLGAAFVDRLQPTEIVRWVSDEWEIEGILTFPAGYREGERYPLLIEAHGGPSWQWEDYCFLDWHDWAQVMASRGFAVLAPNPRGSTGRGAAFQKALQDDVGGGEVRDLIAGARAMVDRGIADPDRLGIGGWSWGGYLTAATIAQTTMFKAAVMGAGLANLVSDHGTDDIPSSNLLYFPDTPYRAPELYQRGSAITTIAACTTPTLILHGDSDDRVHPAQGMEMYRALKTLGVPVEFVRYPRQGHSIKERNHQIDLMRRLVGWFERWLLS